MDIILFFVYALTIALGIVYVVTIPLSWYHRSPLLNNITALRLGMWLRIIIAGCYLGTLLLYLPTIHFILNTVLFTVTVGMLLWYKLIRTR